MTIYAPSPWSAELVFKPTHFSFPAFRCSCGHVLDEKDWCANCNKFVFDE